MKKECKCTLFLKILLVFFRVSLTRSVFWTYYTIAQKDGILAIQKTYPQSGGTRGVASHSDAILINDSDIPHGGDITAVLERFPDEVDQISRRSSGLKTTASSDILLPIEHLYYVLQSVFRVMQGKTIFFPTDVEMSNIDVVRFILDVYSLLPKKFRKNFHPIQINNSGEINYPLSNPIGWKIK